MGKGQYRAVVQYLSFCQPDCVVSVFINVYLLHFMREC